MLCFEHYEMQVVQSLLEGLAGSVGQREVATLTAELIPILIETTGSTNARMAAAASENLLHLAGDLQSISAIRYMHPLLMCCSSLVPHMTSICL